MSNFYFSIIVFCNQSFSFFFPRHGDIIYVTIDPATKVETTSNSKQNQASQVDTKFINGKQAPIDDLLEKSDGLIKRQRDPNL